MTKKYKKNNTAGKYSVAGEPLFHQESGGMVGIVYPAGSEVVASVVASVSQDSEELMDELEDL